MEHARRTLKSWRDQDGRAQYENLVQVLKTVAHMTGVAGASKGNQSSLQDQRYQCIAKYSLVCGLSGATEAVEHAVASELGPGHPCVQQGKHWLDRLRKERARLEQILSVYTSVYMYVWMKCGAQERAEPAWTAS